jgi:hypothetical protein
VSICSTSASTRAQPPRRWLNLLRVLSTKLIGIAQNAGKSQSNQISDRDNDDAEMVRVVSLPRVPRCGCLQISCGKRTNLRNVVCSKFSHIQPRKSKRHMAGRSEVGHDSRDRGGGDGEGTSMRAPRLSRPWHMAIT